MALHTNYEFRWKNYRAFEDTEWITIPSLTVLIGPNNSGKTSLISPLLLLDQTFASRDSVTPLVTRGPLVDAGGYKNVIHNHQVSRDLFLGIRYHIHQTEGKVEKPGTYPPGGVEITVAPGKRQEDIVMKRFGIVDVLKQPFLEQLRNLDGSYELVTSAFTLKNRERKAIHESKPFNFLFSPAVVLQKLQSPGAKKPEKVSVVEPSRGMVMYLSALSATLEELGNMFRDLSYVGPLRERPRRYYSVSGEMPVSVGTRGEHMANLVRRRFEQLQPRLDTWIKRFEFGSGLTFDTLSDEFFSLSFSSDTANKTNIAEAGFGASQVLPLIVQALAARRQSLTIAEQPEIHLNPRLQFLLADLFVEMANSDHRVIVETHSEHLLLRLRRLVADGKIDHSKVAIYFVEKADGVSTVRRIPLSNNGHISHDVWPKGFFEDTLAESLALAAVQSRKTSKREERKNAARHRN